jgi:hypothetical protein
MNNCILDFKNVIKIHQNSSDFFDITTEEKWKYTIIVKFNIAKSINKLNLFFIIKSYLTNNVVKAHTICTAVKTEDGLLIITQKDNILKFKNMDYYMFLEWINFRIEVDSRYTQKDTFYAIFIFFSKPLCDLNNKLYKQKNILEYLRPNYPWKKNWIDKFNDSIEKILLLEEKIKTQEKEIIFFLIK